MVPSGMMHNILLGNFEHINLPTGTDKETAITVFYAGVLAFAEGMFPLKVIAIANSHNRSDLPLALGTFLGCLTRWTICLLASLLLLNKEFILPGATNFALIGVFIFAMTIIMSEIVESQLYI